MRILLISLIFLFTAWLPGQCISVQIDSVFCLANGEYGIFYDVEGTGEAGWVLEGYDVSGSYFTDEIRELTRLSGFSTTLVFRDAVEPDCIFEVDIARPDGCGFTDPCTDAALLLQTLPGSCGSGIRAVVFSPQPADSILVFDENGNVVRESGIPNNPELPNFVDFPDLSPGTYTVVLLGSNGCELTATIVVTDGSAGCGSITGETWLDTNENGTREEDEPYLAGVEVRLLRASDFSFVSSQEVTPSGYFFSDVAVGDYVLQFTTEGRNNPTGYQVGEDPTIDNDVSADFVTEAITVGVDEVVENIDGGFLPFTAIGDVVFEDFNANGQQDAGDAGIAGVVVNLLSGVGDVLRTTTTGGNGFYQFVSLTPGAQYIVEFESPAGFETTPSDQEDDITDSDADETTGQSDVVILELGEFNSTIDAGFYQTGSIGDFVFFDENANGLQDAGDPGVEGLRI